MKNTILKLRAEGLSYSKICSQLGCSKATVAYHCNNTTKTKTLNTTKRLRKDDTLINKVDKFKRRRGGITDKTKEFQRRDKFTGKNSKAKFSFFADDVKQKIGTDPKCYLTGRLIDLSSPNTFHFDHILPVSKGGDNSLENLGIACKAANMSKHDLTLDEFISLCIEVLNFQGYGVAVPDRIERST